ncbi:helix-turn-helix domain-containing protein [Allonocardiopsis opalescens]|uniref:Helix-turn-helix protein n=1 Tax=Allonocardiopsis opalescens TaxID=1144618 RepID=A0A2T0PVK2_9ACTN|nr:helix-turn-helix transcriptional regulator [Allonocardiopsis opalescens]PRX95551.1 helix-turn-helix protein [Allonocardiopsis opalescens]
MAASPTLRKRRIVARLGQLHERSGLTHEAVAREVGERTGVSWSESKASRLVAGKWVRLRERDLLALLDVYGVDDERERAELARTAREASQQGWWVGYRDVFGRNTYVDLENGSSRLRSYQGLLIPGLLQSEGYARALMRDGGITDEEEAERRVEARMIRQGILSRPDAPAIWAVIDEAALLKIPPRTGQLEHLLAIQRPGLRVQILPNGAGLHAAAGAHFVIMDFPSDPAAVYIENPRSEVFLEHPDDLAYYETMYSYVQADALSVDESRALIERMIQSE